MADNNIGVKVTGTSKDAESAVQRVAKSFTNAGRNAKTANKEMAGFYDTTRKLNNQFGNIAKDANRASQSIAGMGKTMNQLAGATGIYAIGNAMAQSIQSAMDMIETINLFSVSMGETADEAQGFVEAFSGATGFDQTNIQSAIGNFTLLARSMGFSTEQAKTLGEQTYQLGGDLSSLFNIPINQVMADLRSGLIGQTETVYKYGIDLTEASLAQEAMSQGIEKSVRNMSQGEKMALRYSLMIKQSALAHGDLARTIDQPANQMRILGERFVTLARSIGTVFIGAISMVAPYINALLQVLINLFNGLAKLTGFVKPEVTEGLGNQMGMISEEADGASDSIDGTTKALKDMKKAQLGIDELNLIPDKASDGGSGGSGAGGGASILPDFDLPTYDSMFGNIQSKSKAIADNMQKVVDNFIKLSNPLITANWGSFNYSVQQLWESLKKLGGVALDGLVKLYTDVIMPIGVWLIEKGLPAVINVLATAFDGLANMFIALAPYSEKFVENVLVPLGNIVGSAILDGLNLLNGALKTFSDWAKNNKRDVQLTAEAIGLFFTMFEIGKVVNFVTESGGVIKAIKGIADGFKFATLWQNAMTVATTIYTGACWLLETAMKAVNFVMNMNPFMKVVAIISLLVGAFVYAYNNVQWFRYGVNNAFEAIPKAIKGALNGIIGVMNNMLGGFEGFLNGIIDGINDLILAANMAKSALGISGWTYPIQKANIQSIPYLARGGQLDAGQAFVAGEAGAELIGSHQGKTTVMPLENTDFVMAIHDAVLSAMTASEGSGGKIIENVLMIDGDVLYRSGKKAERNRGNDFGMGVFAR